MMEADNSMINKTLIRKMKLKNKNIFDIIEKRHLKNYCTEFGREGEKGREGEGGGGERRKRDGDSNKDIQISPSIFGQLISLCAKIKVWDQYFEPPHRFDELQRYWDELTQPMSWDDVPQHVDPYNIVYWYFHFQI